MLIAACHELSGPEIRAAVDAGNESGDRLSQASGEVPVLFEDLTARVLPSLADREGAAALESLLDAFGRQLAAHDYAGARGTLERAESLVARLGEQVHPVTLTTLHLTLRLGAARLLPAGSAGDGETLGR
jgi:hypothetical protein